MINNTVLFLLLIINFNTLLYLNNRVFIERSKYLKLKNETKTFAFENFKLTADLKKMWMEYDTICYKKDINDKIILLFENAKKKMKNDFIV
jgi:hypothetical protein